ncbi:DegT/DnrJ/EryC1/StrS family aminotransferase [Rhizobium rosettiformans]|uniref:DegT/DnrJ/EryC1/StrS family aminotransferase n=1 Tax=Rhizobium rosettiformans TaxID=1368430 RepID=UPI00285D819D|nr:DegT/DnrJ/EryC1/StrS family aminotransferase [Rhizobium rosettiformans]MDR7029001.1 UDP-2-acetamido-2-deoxy-ribo-hexuluronate aminotransferase [Rhizobium rosettiformans]MDR7063717.1 UDP-2-acetamido-2-deoxy-ribo-hexuluronate aminotransferase [Rhizobium rosettiformans]
MTRQFQFIDLKRQYSELKQSIDARIQNVLDHGQYIMGPEVRELEEKLEDYTGSAHCITVASGTEALLIALMALDIKPGDEVITTAFTFIATAEVIALLGAVPVFVDVESDTGNIDATLIEAAITERTRAIIPVSLYGQTADMEAINAIAARHDNVTVIEDAAQSFGANYRDKKSCNVSSLGCTSFFPSKPLGCYGDGGAIFTDRADLANIMRQIRVHGQERRYYHTRIGVGGRMDTIQCAVVLAKLERFDWEVERRIEIGQRYIDLIGNNNLVRPVTVRAERTSVWAQFTVISDQREKLLEGLNAAGIPTAIHYPTPLHRQPAYKDLCRTSGSLANTEYLSERVFSLPMHPYLSSDDQAHIIGALDKAF